MGDAAAFNPLTPNGVIDASHPHWRNNNHQFDAIPSSVQGYVRDQLRIPAVHSAILLPEPKLSVLDLISTSIPPISKSEAHYHIPDGHDFFSTERADPDIELLSRTLVPPRSLIIQLLPQAKQKWLDGAESIRVPNETILLPLWSLQFWSDIHLTIEPARLAWRSAIDWLTSPDLSSHHIEVRDTLDALSTLSWSGYISAASAGRTSFPKTTLACFLSREWLADEQIDQMLYLLEKEIREAHPSREIYLIDTIFTRQLLRVYRSDKSGDSLYDVNADTFLQRFGSTLTPASEIGGIFHIHGDHWVAAAVDIVREALAYGDPAGGLPDDDVVGALPWFISKLKAPSIIPRRPS
ncbi:hypothetical protein FPV67DRAFT_1676708 [Lyophyllum atratum]|nr:hypothetical protein FPV67DRAFT_1676708 [Lyophyllum atratum]